MTNRSGEREAFDAYWALGRERSLVGLHEKLVADGWEVSLRTLEGWSSRFGWQGRLEELERKAHEAADEARVAAIREMEERHAKEGIYLQQRGTEFLQLLEPGTVSAEAAVRALVEGAKLERLARGAPTERTATTDEDEKLKELSDDELERILTHLAAAGLGGEGQA